MALKGEVIEKIAALITAALAWNQAIIAIFKEVFGDNWEGIPQMLTYAILVTILAVILTIWIGRVAEKHKE